MKTVKERLLKHTHKTETCWNWTKYKIKNGYGRIKINKKLLLVHRVSFEIFKGNIPENILVCHSCDNRACINPDHLSLGTKKDNAIDMYIKKRSPNRKMTNDQVKEMKALFNSGHCRKELAVKYRVSYSHLVSLINGFKKPLT